MIVSRRGAKNPGSNKPFHSLSLIPISRHFRCRPLLMTDRGIVKAASMGANYRPRCCAESAMTVTSLLRCRARGAPRSPPAVAPLERARRENHVRAERERRGRVRPAEAAVHMIVSQVANARRSAAGRHRRAARRAPHAWFEKRCKSAPCARESASSAV